MPKQTMTSDRDRLIELLHLAPTEFGKTKNDLTDNRCFVEFAADYLLVNGVIVPPCKEADMRKEDEGK